MFNILSIFSYKRYAYRSNQWNNVRDNFLKKNNKCSACGTSKNLEVHHIIPVHINPELELFEENLITLCDKKCHLLFGHLMNYKSWNTNVISDCCDIISKIKNRPTKK